MDRGFALQQNLENSKEAEKTFGCSGAWWEMPAHDDRVLPASDEALLVNFGFKSSTYAQPSISSQSGHLSLCCLRWESLWLWVGRSKFRGWENGWLGKELAYSQRIIRPPSILIFRFFAGVRACPTPKQPSSNCPPELTLFAVNEAGPEMTWEHQSVQVLMGLRRFSRQTSQAINCQASRTPGPVHQRPFFGLQKLNHPTSKESSQCLRIAKVEQTPRNM